MNISINLLIGFLFCLKLNLSVPFSLFIGKINIGQRTNRGSQLFNFSFPLGNPLFGQPINILILVIQRLSGRLIGFLQGFNFKSGFLNFNLLLFDAVFENFNLISNHIEPKRLFNNLTAGCQILIQINGDFASEQNCLGKQFRRNPNELL